MSQSATTSTRARRRGHWKIAKSTVPILMLFVATTITNGIAATPATIGLRGGSSEASSEPSADEMTKKNPSARTTHTVDSFEPKAGHAFGSSAGGSFNPFGALVDNDCLKPGATGVFPMCDPQNNKCCLGLECIRSSNTNASAIPKYRCGNKFSAPYVSYNQNNSSLSNANHTTATATTQPASTDATKETSSAVVDSDKKKQKEAVQASVHNKYDSTLHATDVDQKEKESNNNKTDEKKMKENEIQINPSHNNQRTTSMAKSGSDTDSVPGGQPAGLMPFNWGKTMPGGEKANGNGIDGGMFGPKGPNGGKFSPVGDADTVGSNITATSGSFPGVSMQSDTTKEQYLPPPIADYKNAWQSLVADSKSVVSGLFSPTPDGNKIAPQMKNSLETSQKETPRDPATNRVVYHPFAPAWVWTWIGFAGLGTIMFGIATVKHKKLSLRESSRLSSHASSDTYGSSGSSVASTRFEWRDVTSRGIQQRRAPPFESF